jgi:hypothetical protein
MNRVATQLPHWLELVEYELLASLSSRSDLFFNALDDLRDIGASVDVASQEAHRLALLLKAFDDAHVKAKLLVLVLIIIFFSLCLSMFLCIQSNFIDIGCSFGTE